MSRVLPLSSHLTGQVVYGYTVGHQISNTEFGTVYDGTDPEGNRVALKFVPSRSISPTPHGQTEAGEQLPEELKVIRRIHEHPHESLVKVLRYGSHGVQDGYVIVMEWAEETLQYRLDAATLDGEPMPVRDTLRHVKQIAAGLDYLSVAGYSHHDLKPANVLLVGGKAKLTDFGFASAVKASLASMTFRGTPHFLPPEVCDNHSAGNSSDQYSLAVMYYWLRRNESPYRELRGIVNPSLGSLIKVHLTASPDLTGLTDGERVAVERALSKDPKKRFPTCSTFVAELVRAVPLPPKPARPNKHWRRRLATLNQSIRATETETASLHQSIRTLEIKNEDLKRLGNTERRWRYALLGLLVLGLAGLGWLGTMVVPSPPPEPAPPWRKELDQLRAESMKSRLGIDQLSLALSQFEKKHDKLKRVVSHLPSNQEDFLDLEPGERPPLLDCTGPTGADARTVRAAQVAWAKFLGEKSYEKTMALDKGGKVLIEMVLVPPGKYYRGSPDGKGSDDERPQKVIMLTKAMWVGKYEVTQAQYMAAAG